LIARDKYARYCLVLTKKSEVLQHINKILGYRIDTALIKSLGLS